MRKKTERLHIRTDLGTKLRWLGLCRIEGKTQAEVLDNLTRKALNERFSTMTELTNKEKVPFDGSKRD